jgi:hypothetical protein
MERFISRSSLLIDEAGDTKKLHIEEMASLLEECRGTIEMDIPALIIEAEKTIDQIAYIIIQKPYYRTIIREVAKQYFLDQISAEEAARQMSDKVGLYLKEQN